MHLSTVVPVVFAALASAQPEPKPAVKGLDHYAKKAGLKYFGSATDTPGQRERAGLDAAYAQYDKIMWGGEFGQTTPTNGMKWLFTEPQQGVFNFTEGDYTANKAKENGLLLRCHALVWHSQLAPFVHDVQWTPETLRAAMVKHITEVAGYYKGRCYAWDVVNEALEDDGSYRKSLFYNTLGEEYIKLAFQTAAKVDPHAKLYYNDYNLEWPSKKTEAAARLVKMLRSEGIKIDGVGLQAHLTAEGSLTLDQHIDAIQSFADLDVEVALTELDIRLKEPATDVNLAQQKEKYKNVVGACVQVKGCIGVTLWDFYDSFSWVPYVFPGEGAAGLWFANFTTHPAYDGIVEALTNKTASPVGKGKGKDTGKGKGPGRRALYRA